MSQNKKYTAKEAALAVLKKCAEVLQKSEEQHGEKIASEEKDQTPPDGVKHNSPDVEPKDGNGPTLGDKVNAVVEAHMAEHGHKEEEKEDDLKGHMKLAKFMGRMEAKREGKQEQPEHKEEAPAQEMPKTEEMKKALKLSSNHEKNAHLYTADKGTSAMGSKIRSANRDKSWAKDSRASSPSTNKAVAKDKMKEVKGMATKKVADIKASPKPNLTKKEIKK